MSVEVEKKGWAKILKYFSDQNSGRLTRLGVFEGKCSERASDEWIERGLPLAGIDADTHDGERAAIEIMLGDAARGGRHYTHNIQNARHLKLHFSPDGRGDAVKIEDAEGKTTVLRFEN